MNIDPTKLKFNFNVNTVVLILGFGVSWLWMAFGVLDDVKDTKRAQAEAKIEYAQTTKTIKDELIETNKTAKREITKIQNTQAQQSSDISAMRVTLESLGSMILRIEQRQFNDRRGDLTLPARPN